MRTIHDHKLNGLNEAIELVAIDQPGPGGANHVYQITLSPPGRPTMVLADLEFQNGPIAAPADMNGLTNEVLIAAVIDRMRGFQYGRKVIPGTIHAPAIVSGEFDYKKQGEFACRENAIALTHLEDALMWLQKRTRDRLARGVEGTHKT